jgi:arylsulfatase A-like enzyme
MANGLPVRQNHLGDRDEHLSTNHGFDEFFGNLYHLNAEEEPETEDYPSPEEFPNSRKNFGPRGVIHSFADGMVEHDIHVGELLATLDRLGLNKNTLVFYSTDNRPHYDTWPDAAATLFRSEKNTNWEGDWRVPALVRWPGNIEAGSISNEIMHHMDGLPTLLAAAGTNDIKERLKEGDVRSLGRSYRVHLDGCNFLPYLRGESESAPREEIFISPMIVT